MGERRLFCQRIKLLRRSAAAGCGDPNFVWLEAFLTGQGTATIKMR
jgi:hypothetical protein